MKRSVYIYLMLLLAISWSCTKDISYDCIEGGNSESVVEVLEDGRIGVSASISATVQTPIETRSTSTSVSPDNIIYTGWCMVFGVDETLYSVAEDGTITNKDGSSTTDDGYGPNSPLLQKTKIVANTNGRFYMTFNTTPDRVFMRIVANLSQREDDNYEGAIAQEDIAENDTSTKAATFGQFLEQSVGLDGIYDFTYNGMVSVDSDRGNVTYDKKNTNSPDPSKLQRAFPMSSYGYVLENGITSETIAALFNEEIKMIRIFSKIVVRTDAKSKFIIDNVTLLKGANESRIRSTVLSSTGGDVDNIFNVIEDLGGAVQYQPVGVVSDMESMPIYLYPNKGGNYLDEQGKVNDVDNLNPTYIIIRGKADGYSDYGYYKVALKAQYPQTYNEDGTVATYSDLTYNILRDTYFSVNLKNIDKPGYATFNDAADEKNPANNISYSIVINGEDNRHEYVVSKGTYYVELKTSRFYAKGYVDEEVAGTIDLSLNPSSEEQHPNIYIYGEGVNITSVTVDGTDVTERRELNGVEANFIEASSDKRDVSITFAADTTGRIAIRSGDILKYIPVIYESKAVDVAGGKLTINDANGNILWDSFAYSEINYTEQNPTLMLNDDGTIEQNRDYLKRSFEARLFPKDGSGFLQLFVKQASDFIMWDNAKGIEAESIDVVFNSKGEVHSSTPSGYSKPTDGKYIYEIKGDEDDITITEVNGNFDSFNPGGNIALNEEFSFNIESIGTNGGVTTKSANVLIDLANTAQETKSYSISITQYAAPDAVGTVDPDIGKEVIDGKTYIIPKPESKSADYLNFGHEYIYTTPFWRAKDRGEQLTTITVQNCFYTASEIQTEGDFGWKWEVAPDAKIDDGNGSAQLQLERIIDALKVVVNEDKTQTERVVVNGVAREYGSFVFDIIMNNGGWDTRDISYTLASGCFVLRVENQIGEVCETRLLLQCKAL